MIHSNNAPPRRRRIHGDREHLGGTTQTRAAATQPAACAADAGRAVHPHVGCGRRRVLPASDPDRARGGLHRARPVLRTVQRDAGGGRGAGAGDSGQPDRSGLDPGRSAGRRQVRPDRTRLRHRGSAGASAQCPVRCEHRRMVAGLDDLAPAAVGRPGRPRRWPAEDHQPSRSGQLAAGGGDFAGCRGGAGRAGRQPELRSAQHRGHPRTGADGGGPADPADRRLAVRQPPSVQFGAGGPIPAAQPRHAQPDHRRVRPARLGSCSRQAVRGQRAAGDLDQPGARRRHRLGGVSGQAHPQPGLPGGAAEPHRGRPGAGGRRRAVRQTAAVAVPHWPASMQPACARRTAPRSRMPVPRRECCPTWCPAPPSQPLPKR